MAQESNQSGYNPIPINTTFNSMAAYASGGFGHIFLMGHLGARWHGKVIKRVEIIQEERDDILREIECAQKCKSVQNPSRHILHFDEVYMDSTHILMEMDLCAFSLHEYPHPIIYEDRMDIMRSISNGILTMHALGIAHRDLKPENILVQRNGNCVIEAAYNAVMDVNEVNEQKEDQLNDDKLQLNDWMSMIMGESDDAVKNNKMNSKETEEQNADEDYKHGIYLDTVDVSTHLKEKIRGSLAKLYKALNQVVTVKQIGAKQVVQMPSNLEDYSVEHMVYLIENNDTILCDKLKPYQAKIVDYFESHQMDGTTWLAQDRKSFLDDVSGYIFEQQ
eukprot:151511_1